MGGRFVKVRPLVLWEEDGEVQVEAEIMGKFIELTNTGVMLDYAAASALRDWLTQALGGKPVTPPPDQQQEGEP